MMTSTSRVEWPAAASRAGPPAGSLTSRAPAGAFADVFQRALGGASAVRFSAHALDRMARRGIALSAADQGRIGHALDAAAAKGARSSLLLMDRCALVVSVPNRTVITVVPSNELDDAVFTNIDSAVVVAARAGSPSGTQGMGPDPAWEGPKAADR